MNRLLLGCAATVVILLSCCGNQKKKNTTSGAVHDDSVPIIQKPVVFDSTRKRLSLEYIELHYGLKLQEPVIHPTIIVLHHTAIDDADSSFDRMNPSSLPPVRKDIEKGGMLNVAAHFLVDREGRIYQLLPDTIFARHTIGLNMSAIGIENVGGNKFSLTAAQLQADERLVRMLKQRHPAIAYMIGHKEYGRFKNSALWLEKDSTYFTGKNDPAGDFITQLRNRVADLQLLQAPVK